MPITSSRLVQILNEPKAVVDAIFDFYEKRGFEPSATEHEVLLNPAFGPALKKGTEAP